MIVCRCPKCAAILRVADEFMGRPVGCPKCLAPFLAQPAPPPKPPPPAPVPKPPPPVAEKTSPPLPVDPKDFDLRTPLAGPQYATTDNEVYTDLVPVEEEIPYLEPVVEDEEIVDLEVVEDGILDVLPGDPPRRAE